MHYSSQEFDLTSIAQMITLSISENPSVAEKPRTEPDTDDNRFLK